MFKLKLKLLFGEDKNTRISILISFAIIALTSILVVVFAIPTHQIRNSLFAFGVDIVLLFFSLQLYIDAGGKKYDKSYWFAEIRATALIVIGLLVGDVLVGLAAHPELPLVEATISHIGFTITAFLMILLLPLLLAQVMCMIRSIFLRFLISSQN